MVLKNLSVCLWPIAILPLNLLSIVAPYLVDVVRARYQQQFFRTKDPALMLPHDFALRFLADAAPFGLWQLTPKLMPLLQRALQTCI